MGIVDWLKMGIFLVAFGLVSACGAYNQSGDCKDYKPVLLSCSEGFTEVCDKKGECIRCSCVSTEDIGPSRPFQSSDSYP